MKANASSFSVGKLLDWGDRTSTSISNNQQYHDSFNQTSTRSTIMDRVGTTEVTIGAGADDVFAKVAPWAALGVGVIVILNFLRRS
jgi:hypothetical protein